MFEQEIAARPRNRKVLTPEELARETFANLQNKDPENVPIVEVLSILSTSKDLGHITYRTLVGKAQEGTLLTFDAKEAATQLTSVVQSRRKEIDKQEVDNSLDNDASRPPEKVNVVAVMGMSDDSIAKEILP
jgi:hypothetical protein